MDFLVNISSGLIVGAVSSFIASKFFLKHNNHRYRPSIDISDKLIKTKRENGDSALQIKMINKTKEDIADVIIEVEGLNNLSPAGSIPLYNLKLIGKREVLYIKKYDSNDTNAHYAHRVNLFSSDEDIIKEAEKYEAIRVSVKATCPYYGTSVIMSVDYNKENDILNENHSFNTGDSLSCSSH